MKPLALCRLVSLSVIVAGSSGCAGALVCPARGGPAWTELKTAHFKVRTDLAPDEARLLSVDFESTWDQFARGVFNASEAPGGVIDLVLIRSRDEFLELGVPRRMAGFFTTRDVDDRPTIVMYGELSRDLQRKFQHEVTHRFLRQLSPRAPLWLHEGLAQYYETLAVAQDQMSVGSPDPCVQFRAGGERTLLRSTKQSCDFELVVGVDRLPALDSLLVADAASFHDPERIESLYFGAWALVQMLTRRPEYQAALSQYMTLLGAGERPSVAWRSAFGSFDPVNLEAEYRGFLLHDTLAARTSTFVRARLPRIESTRSLDDAEVHVLWATLRDRTAPADLDLVRADLDEALARSPDSAEVQYTAALAMPELPLAERERHLRAAIAKSPADPRYPFALGKLVWRRESAKAPGTRDLAAVDDALEPLRSSTLPHAWNLVAWNDAQRGRIDTGLALAERAVAADHDCAGCFDTLALLYSLTGDNHAAAIAEEQAIALLPERALIPPEYLGRYRHYLAGRSQPMPEAPLWPLRLPKGD